MKNSIAIATLLVTNVAFADLRLGAGVNTGIHAGNGIWQQDGMPSTMEKSGETFAIQYISGKDWLRWTIGFSQRQGMSIKDGEWIDDDCYNKGQFSGGPIYHEPPVGPIAKCDMRWYSKNIETRIRAVTFGLQPTYKFSDGSVFLTAGVSLFEGKTTIEWDDSKGICIITQCGKASHKLYDLSSYYELGATYKNVFLTLYYAPDERGGESPQSGNYGVLTGLNLVF